MNLQDFSINISSLLIMDREKSLRLACYLKSDSLDEAKKAYQFITGSEENEKKVSSPWSRDGVYLIYDDGHHEFFNKDLPSKGVIYIGLVLDGHSFAVSLRDLPKKYKLFKNYEYCPKESFMYEDEAHAVNDWDAESATGHIQSIGTDIPLSDGEFIPTAAMLMAMAFYKEQLNKALEFAGGDPLKEDDCYLSSSECNAYSSWVLKFSSGYLDHYNLKSYRYYVRPCTAFKL